MALNAEPAKLPLGQRMGREGAFLCHPDKRAPHPVSLNYFLDFTVSSDVCLSQQPQSFSAPLFASSPMSCPDLADF